MKKKYVLAGIFSIAVILLIIILAFHVEENKKEFTVTVINLTDETLDIDLDIFDYHDDTRTIRDSLIELLDPDEICNLHLSCDKSADIDMISFYAINSTQFIQGKMESELLWNGYAEYNFTDDEVYDIYVIITTARADVNMSDIPYPKHYIGSKNLTLMDLFIIKKDSYDLYDFVNFPK